MDMLWLEFLGLMHAAGSPELTLSDLHLAIVQQLGEAAGTLSPPDLLTIPTATVTVSTSNSNSAISSTNANTSVDAAAVEKLNTAASSSAALSDVKLTIEPGNYHPPGYHPDR